MRFNLVKKSRNRKLGLGVVSTYTSRDSCPKGCPFKVKGFCYGEGGPVRLAWEKHCRLEEMDFLSRIADLPNGSVIRGNVCGDLPSRRGVISLHHLFSLLQVIAAKTFWTYSHHEKSSENLQLIDSFNAVANDRLLGGKACINLSCENPEEAWYQTLKGRPVQLTLPADKTEDFKIGVVDVRICPADGETVTCKTCQWCAQANRGFIIGIPAHGMRERKLSQWLSEKYWRNQ